MSMTLEIEHEYEYKAKWKDILLIAGFFGLCAIGFFFAASEQVLARRASILCAFSIGFVILDGFVLVHKLSVRQRIVFTQTHLLAPKSAWSSKEMAIGYKTITKHYTFDVGGEQTLVI